MSRQTIDGKCYAKMLQGGVAYLSEHKEEINDLNVFPVPDGDTGTNMTMTLEGGLSEIKAEQPDSIGNLSGMFSHGVLLGARGNSGVILSQLFAGINEVLSKHECVSAKVLSEAYECGVKKAYAAVQNPTEGTILTVLRESSEYAAEQINEETTVEEFFSLLIEKAKTSLMRTKDILPVLAEADVVDSGAAGFLYMIMGMHAVLSGKLDASAYNASTGTAASNVDISLFTRDSKLEFGYCTEFLLRLTTDKVDPDSFDINKILADLEELRGESIVAYKEGDIVKVHVHTFTPGAVLSAAQRYGEFLTLKIENMSLGHSGAAAKPKIRVSKKYSTIAVATGEGMCALFTELGADMIVKGGQTANPSTEEFIEAFESCDSEHIIVLPNNKNVFLAAEQAAKIYDKAKVHIIPTASICEGYGALSVITPGISDVDMLVENINRAIKGIVGGEITCAVRDVTLGGKKVNKGDYIAISEKEIKAVAETPEEAVVGLLSAIDMDEYEIVTLFVGKGVTDEKRVELTELLEDEYPDCEIVVYEGGQDVYDYLVAVE